MSILFFTESTSLLGIGTFGICIEQPTEALPAGRGSGQHVKTSDNSKAVLRTGSSLPCMSYTMIWYAPSALKCHIQLSYHRDSLLQPQKEATISLLCFDNTLLLVPHRSPLPLLTQQGQWRGMKSLELLPHMRKAMPALYLCSLVHKIPTRAKLW